MLGDWTFIVAIRVVSWLEPGLCKLPIPGYFMSLFSVGSIFQTKNLKHKCLPLRSRRQGNYSMLSSQLSNFPRTGWVVAAKAACLCSYCSRNHLWFDDRGRLGRPFPPLFWSSNMELSRVKTFARQKKRHHGLTTSFFEFSWSTRAAC